VAKPTKHYDKWRIRWTDEAGKRHSKTFTERKTAELALRKVEIEVEERRRGLRPPELQPRRFSEAAAYWREHRAPLKRSEKDDLSILKQLEAHFGHLLLHDTPAWVPAIDRYRATATKEDKTISNHLVLLGSVLRLARDLGWVERLPVIRKPRVRLHSSSYSYLRTPEEISRFLRAAQVEGEMVHMFYAAAIYTGLRAGELAALRWDDIDWSTRLITVQRS
jgi:integrase